MNSNFSFGQSEDRSFAAYPIQSINEKYSKKGFFFFLVKPINEIIYDTGTVISTAFNDMKLQSEEIECLRRMYEVQTTDGHQEIQDRLQIITQYYHQNRRSSFWSVPPNVFFKAGLNDIYQRRNKKLKNLQAAANSSDDNSGSSSFLAGEFSIQSLYLRHLDFNLSDFLEDKLDQVSSYNFGLQLQDSQTEEYDIYNIQNEHSKAQPPESSNNSDQMKIFLKSNVDHLIEEFNQIDRQSFIDFYRQVTSSKEGSEILSEFLQYQNERKQCRKIASNSENMNPNIQSTLCNRAVRSRKKKSFEHLSPCFTKRYLSQAQVEEQDLLVESMAVNQKSLIQGYLKKYSDNVGGIQSSKTNFLVKDGFYRFDRAKIQLKSKNRMKVRQKAHLLLEKIRLQSQ